jgi:ureidoacrylate peracid hydrolase
VVLTGTVTNVCVETTARDACQREYYVVVVEDCCSALSEEDHRAALRNVDRYFGEVVSSDVLLRAWSAVPAASPGA